ncbi:MAG: CvpA family protein [Alphaproteobacteria bacterium]|nr:CvpA family protein [Alphaproteobacteria bacterium]
MLDEMTKLDYGLAIFLLFFGLRGMTRGGIGKLCDFAVWVGAVYGVIFFYPMIYSYIAERLDDGLNAEIVTVIGLLLSFFIGLSMIAYWLTHQLNQQVKLPLDRTLGFLFGLMQGIVLVVAAFVVLKIAFKLNSPPEWLGEAKSYPWLKHAGDIALHYVPSKYH